MATYLNFEHIWRMYVIDSMNQKVNSVHQNLYLLVAEVVQGPPREGQ